MSVGGILMYIGESARALESFVCINIEKILKMMNKIRRDWQRIRGMRGTESYGRRWTFYRKNKKGTRTFMKASFIGVGEKSSIIELSRIWLFTIKHS